MSTDDAIRTKDLAFPPHISVDQHSEGAKERIGSSVSLREVEREHIEGVLRSIGWDKKIAAKILGISLKTLYTKIQQYHLSKK